MTEAEEAQIRLLGCKHYFNYIKSSVMSQPVKDRPTLIKINILHMNDMVQQMGWTKKEVSDWVDDVRYSDPEFFNLFYHLGSIK